MRNLLAYNPTHKLDIDLSSTTVATGAWTEIDASTAKPCTAIQVAYSGEGILRMSIGDAGEETSGRNELPFYIFPGGSPDMLIPVEIAHGKRLSIRSVDQAVSTGRLVINFFG